MNCRGLQAKGAKPTFANEFDPMNSKPKNARTKIVATVGPASHNPRTLAALVEAGVDVFRLNMAHGTREEHNATLDAIRQVSDELQFPLAVIVDLAGPKIRLGNLPNDALDCESSARLRFVRGETSSIIGELVTNYPKLVDELQPGDRVLLADATVELAVESKSSDAIECRVVQPGTIRSRQGVNLPGVDLSISALSDKDLDAARWATSQDVEFLGLSFVRQAAEVLELKQFVRDQNAAAHVIAKIEKPEALDHLDEIIEAADGVMVARGDLGAEIDIAEVPLVQKKIINACNQRQRPVIVATQMLASMEHSRHPTRAEVTDVANAVLDGADACMLSGETAIGQYPVEAVTMMNRIAETTEAPYRTSNKSPGEDHVANVHQITEAVVYGAARIARQLDASLLVVATRSGATALALSKQRLFTPVLAMSEQTTTLRRLALYWGMTPVGNAPLDDWGALNDFVSNWGAQHGYVEPGDFVVMVTGTGVTEGVHNAVEVHQI